MRSLGTSRWCQAGGGSQQFLILPGSSLYKCGPLHTRRVRALVPGADLLVSEDWGLGVGSLPKTRPSDMVSWCSHQAAVVSLSLSGSS